MHKPSTHSYWLLEKYNISLSRIGHFYQNKVFHYLVQFFFQFKSEMREIYKMFRIQFIKLQNLLYTRIKINHFISVKLTFLSK